MQNTCLVTGGAGFIGCALSNLLAAKFERVVAVDLLHPQVHPEGKRPLALNNCVELVEQDVVEAGILDGVVADLRPSVVIHLAAETGTGQSLTESTRHASVNVVGTTRLLDALCKYGLTPQLILTSSRAVYGEGAWRRKANGDIYYPGQRDAQQLADSKWDFTESDPLPFCASWTVANPVSVYGATKLAQEHIMLAWARAFKAPCSVLRLQNVYGPGQSLKNPYTGVLTTFVKLARDQKVIPLFEDGQMVRDFVFIRDVAEAILAAIDEAPEDGARIRDIGSGLPVTIQTMAEYIADYFQAPAPEVSGQYRQGDVRHASCDLTHTLADLAWRPKISPRQGAAELCEYVQSL
jgi:dTDP-L-rhamnose 4-epimerase